MVASREYAFVTKTSKIVRERYSSKVRISVEIICRLLFFGLVLFMSAILWNVSLDCIDLVKTGSPAETNGVVTELRSNAFTWWALKTVYLKSSSGFTTDYTMYFYPIFPKKGIAYDAVVLPRSKCILAMTPHT